jgi:hypothetical protein
MVVSLTISNLNQVLGCNLQIDAGLKAVFLEDGDWSITILELMDFNYSVLHLMTVANQFSATLHPNMLGVKIWL